MHNSFNENGANGFLNDKKVVLEYGSIEHKSINDDECAFVMKFMRCIKWNINFSWGRVIIHQHLF